MLDGPFGRLLDAFFEGGDDRRLARLAASQPFPQAQLAPSGEDGDDDEVDGGCQGIFNSASLARARSVVSAIRSSP